MSPYLLFLHNNHLEVTHRRLFRFLFCVCMALPLSHESAAAKPLPVVQIAVVRDGPSELVPELRGLIQKEILELTRGEFDVRFPEELQLQGGWSVQGVKQAIDRVLTQPRVDLVIALGILASQEVSKRRQLPKPVIAPLIIDPHLQGLPFKKGTSGMTNLSYLVTGKGFERNLEVFKEVFPFSRLSILADRVLFDAFPLFESRARTLADKHGVNVTVVPVEASIQAALDAMPPDAGSSIAWLRGSLDENFRPFRQWDNEKCNGESPWRCLLNWIPASCPDDCCQCTTHSLRNRRRTH